MTTTPMIPEPSEYARVVASGLCWLAEESARRAAPAIVVAGSAADAMLLGSVLPVGAVWRLLAGEAVMFNGQPLELRLAGGRPAAAAAQAVVLAIGMSSEDVVDVVADTVIGQAVMVRPPSTGAGRVSERLAARLTWLRHLKLARNPVALEQMLRSAAADGERLDVSNLAAFAVDRGWSRRELDTLCHAAGRILRRQHRLAS